MSRTDFILFLLTVLAIFSRKEAKIIKWIEIIGIIFQYQFSHLVHDDNQLI